MTSPAGAALRDILSVLERRFPAIPVLVYPVPVQGATAAPAIARMLALAGERAECDVLILARGGGSLEDLWAFNEEVVARALRDCPIPVVTGVGHETDTTIADLAADRRAATPSAAAEIVAPDRSEWRAQFTHRIRQLDRALSTRLLHTARAITTLSQRLERQHPERRLTARAQRLDELTTRLLRVASLNVQHARQRLATLSRTLDAVSPLATLGRGYAIVMRPDGRLVREAAGLAPGDRVQARLASGRIDCQVEAVHEA